jgi:hypothetical protein
MMSQSIVIALSLCFAGPIAQAEPQNDDGVRPARRERGGPSETERQEWRARRERYLQASPEERRRLRLERWVRMTTRTYELDEAQQVLVRGELETMQVERRVELGTEAEEYDRLRDTMVELWAKAEQETGGELRRGERWRRMRDNPEFTTLREQMRKINEKHPFNMEAAIQRVEKLLPEAQVEKGRARRAQWRERGGRWRERRQRREEQSRGNDAPANAPRRPPERKAAVEADVKAAEEAGTGRAITKDEKRKAEPAEARTPRKPHPWEEYVRRFIKRTDVTEAQSTAAMSILKDVQKRASQIEKASTDKITAAKKIKDKAGRKARLEELKKPIDRLFDELKKRLDGLLTASQRAKGESK